MAERIGIILVHGIGEQRRFEHLETQIRGIIASIKEKPRAHVTVEILGGSGATYFSNQDTWAGGRKPSVRITVRGPTGRKEINVHEVWWADVNEPYSLAKQVRFWFWGLSVWAYPFAGTRKLAGFTKAMKPIVLTLGRIEWLWLRVRLLFIGTLFLVSAFSLGGFVFLVTRLFNFDAPDITKIFTNYLSSIKLYNQQRRIGAGFWLKRHDFLDTIGEPPRVSVRRRMIRTIAAVALADYERWYILAHSLGSVVAFNGIMEYGQSFANFLNKDEWLRLRGRKWAGDRRPGDFVINPVPVMEPARPVWLKPNELVYRDEIFKKFRGFLTYGCPLGKFSTLWPARVPLNKAEACFSEHTEWINVFDPLDPVSGPIRMFSAANLTAMGLGPAMNPRTGELQHFFPTLHSIGYASHPVLLYGHIRYLSFNKKLIDQCADRVADWILVDGSFNVTVPPGKTRWFDVASKRDKRRNRWAYVWWVVGFSVLSGLGSYVAWATGLTDLIYDKIL